jgi:hypothetical protein
LTYAAVGRLFCFAVVETVTFALLCDQPSRSCVEYSDGSLHNVLTFELIVVGFALLAIVGYWRASVLFERERGASLVGGASDEDDPQAELLQNTQGVST